MNKKVYVNLSQQDVQDIINAYEKDIEKFNKQKEIIDKIKEYTNNIIFETKREEKIQDDILELLEEIE